MARKQREWYENACYHVMGRGNRRAAIFKSDEDHIVFLMQLVKVMKADAIRKIYVKSLKGYLDRELEEYCTCDDYYQPVVEDFELDYHLKDWSKKNGFKIISCEGDGDDSGFEPDSVRRWIKYQT